MQNMAAQGRTLATIESLRALFIFQKNIFAF